MAELAKAQAPLVVAPGLLKGVGGWVLCFAAALFYMGSVVVINLLQMLSLLLIPFSRKAFRSVNRWFADTWWGWCAVGTETLFHVKPVFTGDDVPQNENALVFANHQGMVDILVLLMFAWRKRRLGDMKWFAKNALKYIPGIGWGLQFLDCIFVKRDWLADKDSILATFERFLRNHIPIWLITFVEGTRITSEKIQRSNSQCDRKKIAPFTHVLIPKTRGFTAALEGLEGHIDAIYDVTIGYEGGVPKLHHIFRGTVRRVFIDVRRFPLASLPPTEPERATWLYDRFRRKDRLLGRFFEQGFFSE